MIGRPSAPIAIDVWRPTALAVSTAIVVAAVHCAFVQWVTRRSPFVKSKWLTIGRPSGPMAIDEYSPTLLAVSRLVDSGGVPMGSHSTVPLASRPRRYCPAGQVPNAAAAEWIAPGANWTLVTAPGASCALVIE